MDTRHPHDLREFEEIPEPERRNYVPVPRAWENATPEERAKLLAALRARMIEVPRVSSIASKITDDLQRAVDPLIDLLDEDAPDHVNLPRILGLLVGVRAWFGHFQALEDRLVPALESCGISRADYDGMRLQADADGIRAVELVQKLVEGEEAAS